MLSRIMQKKERYSRKSLSMFVYVPERETKDAQWSPTTFPLVEKTNNNQAWKIPPLPSRWKKMNAPTLHVIKLFQNKKKSAILLTGKEEMTETCDYIPAAMLL